MTRPAFSTWFAMTVGLGIGLFFAFYFGLPQRIWLTDRSYMTSVVGAVCLGTVGLAGRAAWWKDGVLTPHGLMLVSRHEDWVRTAAMLCPALGLIGTVYGLSLQAAALQDGSQVLPLLATALFSTLIGVAAMVVLELFHFAIASSHRG